MLTNEVQGTSCTELFKAAYENRYTWESNFLGYEGNCSWTDGQREIKGTFSIGKDLKATVNEVHDEQINKAISSQLWEVAIHRVRRSFEQTHAQNTFIIGEIDNVGTEVLVGGKNSGDRYRIKNNVITMVHRHIHGRLVNISTKSIFETGNGYLSNKYSSQYCDPLSGAATSATSHFDDTFIQLGVNGPWVLSQRVITSEPYENNDFDVETFEFYEMTCN